MDLCLVNAHILYNNHSTGKLTQLEFRTEVGKSLLDGFQSQVTRHFMSVDLPLLLTERPFSEPIPSDTPHGGHPQCEMCRSRKKKDHKHNINVNNVKHCYIYTHVLKSITPHLLVIIVIINLSNHLHHLAISL